MGGYGDRYHSEEDTHAADSGLLSNKREVGQNVFLFYSYNDLLHEKCEHFKEQLPTLMPFCTYMITVTNTAKVNKYARKGSVVVKKFIAHFRTIKLLFRLKIDHCEI